MKERSLMFASGSEVMRNSVTSSQWCAGQVTVNKVVDRQNLKSTVNKLTVTFDHSTIIGNDLSASFGTGWLTTMFTFIINLSSYHVMQPLLSTVHLLFLVLTCTATLNLKGGKVIDYLTVIDSRRLSSDCWLWLWRLTVDRPSLNLRLLVMSLPFWKITQRVVNFDSSHSEPAKKLEESGILPSPSHANYTSWTDMEITSNISLYLTKQKKKNNIVTVWIKSHGTDYFGTVT